MSATPIDLLIRNARIVACDDAICAATPPGFVAVTAGRITAMGIGEPPRLGPVRDEVDAEGALLTPGLIDCHTHLVYAGNRAREFEMRLEGASYEAIARAGGGIVSTVRQTREADVDTLVRRIGAAPAITDAAWRDDGRDQVGLRPSRSTPR